MRDIRPAERALGCFGSILAVPTLAPMAALMALLPPARKTRSPFVQKAIFVLVLPLLFVLFVIASVVFLPYMLLVKGLGKAGVVRLKMPASTSVVGHVPGSCQLNVMVPEDERDTAASMLTAIADRVAAAAGVDAADARQRIAHLAATAEYGRSERLELRLGDTTVRAEVFVDQGYFNADVSVDGDEACVSAAASV